MWKHNELKTAEAAWKLLQLAGGHMQRTKLNGLLYITDREALARWERPVTTFAYILFEGFPLLVQPEAHLQEKHSGQEYWQEFIAPFGEDEAAVRLEKVLLQELCEAEVELLESVHTEFGSMGPDQLREHMKTSFAELNPPVPVPQGELQIGDVLRAAGYSHESVRRITMEMEEEAAVHALLFP